MRVFSLLFSILAFSLGAQNYQWAVSDTTYQLSSGTSIAVDSTGNIAVSQTLGDDKNIDVVKYDANQNVLWRKRIYSFLIDYSDVAMDQQGNVYFSASFFTYVNIDGTQYNTPYSGCVRMVLVKFNAQGVVQWVKQSTGCDAGARALTVDFNSNVYVMGGVGPSGPVNFDSLSANPGLFVVKYNKNGVVQWVRSSVNGDGSSGDGPKIKASKSGNIYIAGLLGGATAFGTHSVSTSGDFDVYIAKLDSAGNWLWAKRGGGIYEEWLYGLDVDDNDNAQITGYFHSPTATFGNTSITNTTVEDYFLAKYDSNGNELWAKGGAKMWQGNSFCVDAVGNSYMVSYGTFLRKHDFNGSYMWHTLKNIHNGRMVSDKKGSVYITGNLKVPATFGSTTINPIKMQQMFVAKLYDPSPVVTKLSEMNKHSLIELYPNPAQDYFYIASDATDKVLLRITNPLGQLVHSELVNTSERPAQKINVAHLSKGLYIAEVFDSRSKEILQTKKLIVN
ncbi:T9SS type A sorting domain-containing protein [Candidatus Dependentiae bacterium]|nr:T9SS type A sorting domain-containing protein [Candidatus Dependentiae bacterium]